MSVPRGKKRKYQGPPCILRPSEEIEEQQEELPLRNVRDVGLFCLLPEPRNARGVLIKPVKPVVIHNRQSVEGWVLLNIPHINAASLPSLRNCFDLELPTVAQFSENYGWSAISELGRMANKDSKSKNDSNNQPKNKPKKAKCTLEQILPRPEVLAKLGFPTVGEELNSIEGSGEAFAIDCEMCLAGSEHVLTRLAVVRFSDGEVLIDQLVKPSKPITDFVTAYSGITPEMLADVDFTLKDAQTWLKEHIGRTDFLIGHSLDNDLNVLGVQHPRIIDTSLLFPHYRGLPFRSSLKYLTKKYLGWDIQTSHEQGHNPVEDATACDRLVRLILAEGPEFGDIRLQSTPLSALLSQSGVHTTLIGSSVPEWDGNGTADHLVLDAKAGAEQFVDAILKTHGKGTAKLIVATLDGALLPTEQLNSAIARLIRELPPHILVTAVLGTGQEDAVALQELRERKLKFRREYRTKKWDEIEDPWTSEDDNRMREAVNKMKKGTAFFKITMDGTELDTLPMKIRDRMIREDGEKKKKKEKKEKQEERDEEEEKDTDERKNDMKEENK